jgi:hypothetical protein
MGRYHVSFVDMFMLKSHKNVVEHFLGFFVLFFDI